MRTNHEKVSAKDWIRSRLPQLGQVVLLFFVGYILADVLVELLAPTTGSAQGSFEVIAQQMRSLGYWIRKLIVSVLGGLVYLVLLWYWKPRDYSTNTIKHNEKQ